CTSQERERESLLKLKYRLKHSSNRLSSRNSNRCQWNNITSVGAELHLSIQFSSSDESVGYPFNEEVFEEALEEGYGGEINPCLVYDFKHFNYLDFRDNLFQTIPIPSFIATITSLTHLNLSNAGIIGTLPSQIGNLSDSLYLDLQSDETWFTDNIDWVSSLSKLRYLALSNIWPVGGGMPIPSFVGTMTTLIHLARKRRNVD
ncbi:receptor-like protein EIX2, partial [Vigna umbellata]|uniref:receptor-like protein EIX2 n=1 Tax=Vigna umbellata TaxID=87088 RepID=UPI001F5FC1F6